MGIVPSSNVPENKLGDGSYWKIDNEGKVALIINPKINNLNKIIKYLGEMKYVEGGDIKQLKNYIRAPLIFEEKEGNRISSLWNYLRDVKLSLRELKVLFEKFADEIKRVHQETGMIIGSVPKNGIIVKAEKERGIEKVRNIAIIYPIYSGKPKSNTKIYELYDFWNLFYLFFIENGNLVEPYRKYAQQFLEEEVIDKKLKSEFSQTWFRSVRELNVDGKFKRYILGYIQRKGIKLRRFRDCNYFIEFKRGAKRKEEVEGAFGQIYFGVRKNEKTGKEKGIVVKLQPLEDIKVEGIQEKEMLKELSGREPLIVPRFLETFVCSLFNEYTHEYVPMEAIVMEKMDGDLSGYIKNKEGKRSYEDIVKYSIKLLNWLHRFGYFHGDIKPNNILYKVFKNGKTGIYLVDFSYGRKMDKKKYAESAEYRRAWNDHVAMDYLAMYFYFWVEAMKSERPEENIETLNNEFEGVWKELAKSWVPWNDAQPRKSIYQLEGNELMAKVSLDFFIAPIFAQLGRGGSIMNILNEKVAFKK